MNDRRIDFESNGIGQLFFTTETKRMHAKDLTLYDIMRILNKPEFKDMYFSIKSNGSCCIQDETTEIDFNDLDEFVGYCLEKLAENPKDPVKKLKELL